MGTSRRTVWCTFASCFLENGVMVEYDNSKEDNTALERQRPVYYGGYAYSEQSGTFVRHGKGRLLHVFTGMTQFEGVWNMGMMAQDGVKYTDGKNDWRINNYSLRELTDKIASNVVSVNSSSSLEKLSSTVSDLTITQGGNDTHLSFSSFRCLRTLVLGGHVLQPGELRSLQPSPAEEAVDREPVQGDCGRGGGV